MTAKIFMLITAVFVFSACSGNSAPDFKEGKWSIETHTEMEGMPMPMEMAPVTIEQCMTAEDRVPAQRNQDGSQCEVVDQKIDGSTVSWNVVCSTSKGSGSITYSDESFEGTSYFESASPMGTIKMKSTMKGRYIGPCQ